MAQIRIDYDGLAQQSAALKRFASDLEALNKKTSLEKEAIKSGWKGPEAEKYAQNLETAISKGNTALDLILRIQRLTDEVSNSFQNVDQNCARQIRNSF